MHYHILVANNSHTKYAKSICNLMEEAAKDRGTGIAKRKPDYLQKKMIEGQAVIAMSNSKAVGFCYIESWEGAKYVANSGLIVHPDYRNTGLAKAIKQEIFQLSKQEFPNSKLFGITTSMAVMKINSDLGYQPVTFSELTQDEKFWKGCQTCTNFDILQRTNKKMCLCTGMICNLSETKALNTVEKKISWEGFKRFVRIKNILFKKDQLSKVKPIKIKLK